MVRPPQNNGSVRTISQVEKTSGFKEEDLDLLGAFQRTYAFSSLRDADSKSTVEEIYQVRDLSLFCVWDSHPGGVRNHAKGVTVTRAKHGVTFNEVSALGNSTKNKCSSNGAVVVHPWRLT